MNNKVIFGFENVHIAVMKDESTVGNPVYDKPVPVPGAVSFSPSADSQENAFYADNMKYFVSYTNNGKKGDLVMANFPDKLLCDIYGWDVDEYGGVLQVSTSVPKRFALLAQIRGDVMERRFVLYGCSSGVPSVQYETTTETAQPKTVSMSVTAAPVKLPNGKTAVQYDIGNTEDGKILYDSFFDEVYIPGTTSGF